ncbi:phosphoesterase PA-phosphatase related protein [Desulfarculus baarsii DSM 2075]|uniref:Phosphoesterase PA-phosphatase related protein n=1 Tax=Desulfarculus baarsii (strain ATCC 33931 / DSM 2075 / LMG 7858 / VKM B-1802 / 2st14) TaxID=644282 RepID=E1QLD3_DESB2|nr:phosphatase PAP2 family protein [Desulfarculus baarsii]ADK86368.1 phosphoesterase PA-phosphatase related protein [Desulfarculus baarsii DSM 2075]
MWDLQLIHWLQGFGPWLVTPMKFFSALGYSGFYILFIGVVYWLIDPRLGLRLAVIAPLASLCNFGLKLFMIEPRPYWLDPTLLALSPEKDLGMPSGHAMGTAAMWGYLALWVGRPWFWALCLGLLALIGLSRLVLAAHFPDQVLAGWALGGALAVAAWRLEEPLAAFLRRWPAWRIWLGLGLTAALMLLGLWLHGRLAGWTPPALWTQNALAAAPKGGVIDPLRLKYLFAHGGALAGVVGGGAWIWGKGSFRPATSWPARLKCLALGLAGVMLLGAAAETCYGLAPESAVGLAGMALLSMASGAWATAVAPFYFVRLGWAMRREPVPGQAKRVE